MAEADAGKIKVNRENDPLTLAIGNPEHPGRTRGKGTGVPWKEGFPQDNDPYRYKSRKRTTDQDAYHLGNLERDLFDMKKMVHEALASRSAGPHEDHVADVESQQQRSSVASTEVLAGANAPTIDGAQGPRYPVDDVHDIMKECELHQPMRNISFKVAIGTALPCLPGALHHNNPIPAGYARVTVDDTVKGYEDLEIDYATPKGDVRLGDVKGQIILWQKKYIKFPGSAPRPPTPRNQPSPPSSGGGGPPTPPSRQPTLPLSPPPAGNPTPPPSPPPAGNPTPPPNPPSAKKQKQGVKEGSKVTSWIINPEPYVPKTIRVPTPSLKPLYPRPWEMSVEENKAAAAAEYEKWKAEVKAKKEPEPKPVYTEKQKKWAYKFLTAEPQFRQNLKDDYEHEIRRQQSLQKKKVLAEEKDLLEKKPTSKKCGKQVPQSETQKNNRSPRS
jgi:hypothetical protein